MGGTVNDGDGLAPVALAGEHPVAQAEADHGTAQSAGCELPRDLGLGLGRGQAVEIARVHRDAVFEKRPARLGGAAVGGPHHGADRQIERTGKFIVALVVRWHRHDRAGAIAGKHVVGDPDRDLLAVDRIDGKGSGERARLLLGQIGAFQVALAARGDLIRAHSSLLRRRSQSVDQRVFGGQHHVGRAVQGIGPRGEDLDVFEMGTLGGFAPPSGRNDLENRFRPLGATDPVALHGQGGLGPVNFRQVFQQPVCVARDAQQPLAHIFALDSAATTLATALTDFLVGQPRLARRAPVDGHGALVGQALFEELQKDPLRPLDVLGIGGVDLAIPVVGKADGVDLAAEVGDGLLGGHTRVDAGLDGVVLGRQTKGVPAHGVQNVPALHALPACDDVGGGVTLAVSDVQPRARGIGKHVQGVELGPAGIERGLMQAGCAPAGLPLGFNRAMVVGHGGAAVYTTRHSRPALPRQARQRRPSGPISSSRP